MSGYRGRCRFSVVVSLWFCSLVVSMMVLVGILLLVLCMLCMVLVVLWVKLVMCVLSWL